MNYIFPYELSGITDTFACVMEQIKPYSLSFT